MTRIEGRTEDAPSPDLPLAQSVRIGSVVAASGQVGFLPGTMDLIDDDDVAAQTRQTFANLKAVLAASGAGLDDVIRVGVFLTDVAHSAAMNEVYRDIFDEPFPARTTVYVGLPGAIKVEIDAMAVVSD